MPPGAQPAGFLGSGAPRRACAPSRRAETRTESGTGTGGGDSPGRHDGSDYDNLSPAGQEWRGVAIRYEKTATSDLAGLHIAGIFLWSAR
ncbi:hypothetical protein [Kitasatospora sp. NPDC087314]|uniref:hypothetical protein n=1 Tax=Kitasatospora sp. NPDC087314 TaxID=3364068 RepID=UPI0038074AF7